MKIRLSVIPPEGNIFTKVVTSFVFYVYNKYLAGLHIPGKFQNLEISTLSLVLEKLYFS